ncbi:MAG: hypothetical protein B6D61_08885 [Bacteroidetes bacterium 4484_249]|nr:MAG: hypothetical protein B6D61_08885 [Bacteroidetes bacterium 4484_249]
MKKFDVIIIGAGVAGSYLGYLLTKKGLKVLLLEKNKKIKKDSGIVSTNINKFLKIKKELIKQKIKKMKFVSPSNRIFYLKSKKPFAYVLQRKKFGMWLRNRAREVGAKIIYEQCKKVEITQNYVLVHGNRKYAGKVLVGADGASSVVRRHLSFKSPRIFNGLIYQTRKNNEQDITIYLNKYFSSHFFAWCIPKNNEYGMITKNTDSSIFFQKKIGFKPIDLIYSPIPVGCTKSFSNRCLLVGDACGQVKPITGGGIIYSLICSNTASYVLSEAFEKNRFDEKFLSKYERLWKREIGKEIGLQLLIRKYYRKMTNKQVDIFFEMFGKDIENIDNFNYDKISTIIWKLPKIKILKFLLKNISLLFEWTYD